MVIGVAGGTGCGKSSLAKRITQGLGAGNITELCHDYYYKDISHLSIEERAKTNFDHPNSLDTKLLINHLEKLKNEVRPWKSHGTTSVPTVANI